MQRWPHLDLPRDSRPIRLSSTSNVSMQACHQLHFSLQLQRSSDARITPNEADLQIQQNSPPLNCWPFMKWLTLSGLCRVQDRCVGHIEVSKQVRVVQWSGRLQHTSKGRDATFSYLQRASAHPTTWIFDRICAEVTCLSPMQDSSWSLSLTSFWSSTDSERPLSAPPRPVFKLKKPRQGSTQRQYSGSRSLCAPELLIFACTSSHSRSAVTSERRSSKLALPGGVRGDMRAARRDSHSGLRNDPVPLKSMLLCPAQKLTCYCLSARDTNRLKHAAFACSDQALVLNSVARGEFVSPLHVSQLVF